MITEPTFLLDANILIALTVPDHVHNPVARTWFARNGTFATCPTVQGAALRALLRHGVTATQAQALLRLLATHERHQQWMDDISYLDVDLSHLHGHRQITDAYLAQLARTRGGRLATFDRGLAQLAPDVVELVSA